MSQDELIVCGGGAPGRGRTEACLAALPKSRLWTKMDSEFRLFVGSCNDDAARSRESVSIGPSPHIRCSELESKSVWSFDLMEISRE